MLDKMIWEMIYARGYIPLSGLLEINDLSKGEYISNCYWTLVRVKGTYYYVIVKRKS